MKTIAFLILSASLGACAVDAPKVDPTTAVDQQNFICNPCDPGNFQDMVSAYVGAGSAYGYQSGPVYCRYVPDDEWGQHRVCSGNWQDDGLHQTHVSCTDQSGADVCYTWGCGETGEPACSS